MAEGPDIKSQRFGILQLNTNHLQILVPQYKELISIKVDVRDPPLLDQVLPVALLIDKDQLKMWFKQA